MVSSSRLKGMGFNDKKEMSSQMVALIYKVSIPSNLNSTRLAFPPISNTTRSSRTNPLPYIVIMTDGSGVLCRMYMKYK